MIPSQFEHKQLQPAQEQLWHL